MPTMINEAAPTGASMRATSLTSTAAPIGGDLSRRKFLRGAIVAGGGVVAATLAACTIEAPYPTWTPLPAALPGPTPNSSVGPVGSSSAGETPSPTSSMDHGAGPGASPGTDAHDANAMAVVKRFLDGESAALEGAGNQPYGSPRAEGDTKVFELTVDTIKHRIDALKEPLDALGFNGMWPGPRIDVVEGDKVRAIFRNKMKESTGIHFHGQRIPNNMDGVPHITQDPIEPGASFTYEFTARTVGSHMYHSHHNATDQVGRGLLGAFIVHPKEKALRVEQRYGVSQDIVWISNDTLGGFTINGRGFPATAPIVATLGDKILVRFMNEGVMMHPWHLHGMPMRVVARDGYDLGPAAFTCDTLGVNPGERWDVVIECDEPGAWAFHCHILPHAEGTDGMYGMVTALVVQPPAGARATSQDAGGVSTVRAAAVAAGSTAWMCQVG
jgi:FtsP/CotA-like multicopper oxidase with cupredoxin domain